MKTSPLPILASFPHIMLSLIQIYILSINEIFKLETHANPPTHKESPDNEPFQLSLEQVNPNPNQHKCLSPDWQDTRKNY